MSERKMSMECGIKPKTSEELLEELLMWKKRAEKAEARVEDLVSRIKNALRVMYLRPWGHHQKRIDRVLDALDPNGANDEKMGNEPEKCEHEWEDDMSDGIRHGQQYCKRCKKWRDKPQKFKPLPESEPYGVQDLLGQITISDQTLKNMNDMHEKLKAAEKERDEAMSDMERLKEALEDLISVAEGCDSWESFPSDDLDKAYAALKPPEEKARQCDGPDVRSYIGEEI